MQPLVSVIIPTHNYAKFIGATIDSVLNQTYKNFELILIDDASQDNTHEVVEKYLSDSRIKYIKHETNIGVSSARNTGLKNAKGEFIAFLDSDDLWLPLKLEHQVKILSENKNIGFVNCSGFYIYDDGRLFGEFKANRERIANPIEIDFFYHCSIPNPMSSILVRKNIMAKIGVFDEKLHYGEDREWLLRLVRETTFMPLEEPGVKIRKHAESAQKNLEKRVHGYITFMKRNSKGLSLINKYHWFKAMGLFYFTMSYGYLNSLDKKKAFLCHLSCLKYFPFYIFTLKYHVQTLKCIIGRKKSPK